MIINCFDYWRQENFTVQNMGFTENYPEYAPSYRMPTTLSAKGDLDHMLHVRGKLIDSYMHVYATALYILLC
jgi:hypothetical protein